MPVQGLLIEGYKSIRDRTHVDLGKLTIMSGANSSGKSSVMQPMLLLKQTYEAGYDPGPLLISGPNAVFSETDQMLWSAPGEPHSDSFTWGLSVGRHSRSTGVQVTLRQQRDGPTPLSIKKCIWDVEGAHLELTPGMTSDELKETIDGPAPVGQSLSDLWTVLSGTVIKERGFELAVTRERAVLVVSAQARSISMRWAPDPFKGAGFEEFVRKIIHVPATRGNPRRTYPVTAVEEEFPGFFQDYVASVIARWQKVNRAKVNQLGRDLRELGLTWKVRAEQKSDTEVEILVGRLPVSRRGGSRDLVSIADVGFGFSQLLPVVVALLAASPDQLLYIEQPEIHLHPRAQAALPDLILRAVARGVQVVVETHSELFLLGIQRLVATGSLDAADVRLHWFHRDPYGVTHITTADIDEAGTLGDVPIDFAAVNMAAMREYLEAAASRR